MSQIANTIKEELEKQKPATRELTFGEKRVRILFNVNNTSDIDLIKTTAAKELNRLEAMRIEDGVPAHPEKQRLISLSQTAFEEAAMWAVKAITFNEK